jgi:hypothetical protein
MRLISSFTSKATVALASALLCSAATALLACAPAFATGPATVTVRVEGATQTLVPATGVTTTPEPVSGDGNPAHSCPGSSALGALALASGGQWTGTWYESFHAWAVESVMGESHTFESGSFWDFWLDHKESFVGLCEAEPEGGSEVLLFPCPASGTCPSPLGIEAPVAANVGEPVSVKVIAYSASGTSSPVAGASVADGTGTVTTGADGRALVAFPAAGTATLVASAPETVRDEATVCVHDGEDGTCGTSAPHAPGAPSPPATHTPEPTSGVLGATYRGPYALVAAVGSVRNGHTYTRAGAPRLLSGTIQSHSAVTSVSLKLRRSYRGRCYAYDATRARFVRAHCGSGQFFNAASGAAFSYLLPRRLAPGRYVLDVEALDVAGNRTTLARGTSRIVFYVR